MSKKYFLVLNPSMVHHENRREVYYFDTILSHCFSCKLKISCSRRSIRTWTEINYLKATQPPRVLGIHQVTIKLARSSIRLLFFNLDLIQNSAIVTS